MYQAASSRYETIPYRRCGASGLKLGAFSLGLWHNFGDTAPYENMRDLCRTALTMALPTSTWPTTTVPSPGRPRRTSAKSSGTIWPPIGTS